MSKPVIYRNCVLSKGSTALELWEAWQRDKSADRNAFQKKLDSHMKEIESKNKDLRERHPDAVWNKIESLLIEHQTMLTTLKASGYDPKWPDGSLFSQVRHIFDLGVAQGREKAEHDARLSKA